MGGGGGGCTCPTPSKQTQFWGAEQIRWGAGGDAIMSHFASGIAGLMGALVQGLTGMDDHGSAEIGSLSFLPRGHHLPMKTLVQLQDDARNLLVK